MILFFDRDWHSNVDRRSVYNYDDVVEFSVGVK